MANNFDDFQKFGKEQLETVTATSASLAKSLHTITAEAADYSKKSVESNSAFFEKLLGAKSLDAAIQIHSEYTKNTYATFVAKATKIGEIYTNLAKEIFKPLELSISKTQAINE
jgi:hypothetical protein